MRKAKTIDARIHQFEDDLKKHIRKLTSVPGKWIEFNARPGDVFLIKEKEILIGDINSAGGRCNCCAFVNDYDDVIWLRNILVNGKTDKKVWTVAAGKIHKGLESRVRDNNSDEWRYGHNFQKKVGKKFQTDDGTFKICQVLV